MSIYLFARFHARPGEESELRRALLDVLGPSREESGCLSIHAFRSVRDPLEFYIHSRWTDRRAFEHHAELPHTLRFLERARGLVDHEIRPTLAEEIG